MSTTRKSSDPLCQGCPNLDAFGTGTHRLKLASPKTASVIFLGSGPTKYEVEQGKAAYEDSTRTGHKLRDWISRANGRQSSCAFGHIVLCQLAYKKGKELQSPKAGVQQCYKNFVGPWLRELEKLSGDDLHVVTLGPSSTKFMLGLSWAGAAENYVGTIQELETLP